MRLYGKKSSVLSFWQCERPFNWVAWKVADTTLPKGSKELERWHLWNFHAQRTVDQMASWLAEAARKKWNASTVVEVKSTWIDCRPVAWFELDIGTPPPLLQKCEAGDLLMIVKSSRKHSGKPVQRALLFQAKCCDSTQNLDVGAASFPGSQSTHVQRNLYESHDGTFELKKSGGLGAMPVGGPYALAKAKAKPFPMLGPFARYLLIPRTRSSGAGWKKWRENLPYQTMWPSARNQLGGECDHLADVLLAMSGLAIKAQGEIVEVPYNNYSPPSDWTRLINDILGATQGKSINRFTATKKAQIKGGQFIGVFKHAVERWLDIPSPLWISRWNRLFQFHMAPPSSLGTSKSPDVPQGMLVVQVRVSDD